jgi:predicted nucleic-acid-binding Zn-ribbon protein
MFDLSIEDRLSSWAILRTELETADDPFQLIFDFWVYAPFVPYNRNIDQYHQKSWPSPWQIIVDNQYDDFTKALMIAYSLKFTKRFKESVIELRTIVDKNNKKYYNIVCIDNKWVINYGDNIVILENIPDSFLVENLIEIEASR